MFDSLNILEYDFNQFKTSLLLNKLESIFVDFFDMVNNLILNSIAKDKNGKLYVKPSAILQKDIMDRVSGGLAVQRGAVSGAENARAAMSRRASSR